MAHVDVANLRAAKRFARQDYDKQVTAQAGPGRSDYGAAGPPYWSMEAWDSFHAQYGFWPYSAAELPPNFVNCPDWAYERMGLRRPPVTVAPGAES